MGLSISWNIANTGAVATSLAHRYGTSLAVIGLLTTVLFFGELAVLIPGGRAIDRYGAKRVGVAAVLLSLIGNVLLLLTTAPVVALLLRGVAGVGLGLGFLAGAIYAQEGAGSGAPLAGGIFGGVSLSGGGLALAIVPALTGVLGWRSPYWSGAAVALVALPLLALCPPTPGHGGGEQPPSLRTLLRDRVLARLGLFASVSFGFSVILGNWVVTLLEHVGGYHKAAAGAVGSLILILGIVGRPTGGILVRALPQATWRVLALSFALGALGTALLTISAGRVADVLGAVLAGLAAGLPFGATMAGSSAAYPSAPGAAVGAMNTYPVIVIVTGAPLLGLTFSLAGHGRIGFGLLAALWACAILAIPWRRPLRLSAGGARSDAGSATARGRPPPPPALDS